MSLRKLQHYLKLLYTTTSRNQQVALLDTVSEEQSVGISEILYNIVQQDIQKPQRKRLQVLKKLFNKKLSYNQRRRLIQSHLSIILDTLLKSKRHILKRL